jgi:hypothetical protein
MPRAIVNDFLERSVNVACEAVDAPIDTPSPGLFADATDFTFLVYPANETRVVLLDARLKPLQQFRFETAGPAGIREVQAIAAGVDGTVWIADQRGRAIKQFGPEGLLRAMATDFVPTALVGDSNGIFAAAANGGEAKLLYALRGEDFTPLPVRSIRQPDFLLSMLANQVVLASLPGGGVLAAHSALVPVADLWTPGAGARTRPLPYPDAARGALDYRPRIPLDDEAIGSMAVGALGISADRSAQEFLLLTRSGRLRAGRPERAIIRTDAEMRYVRSYLLDVHAVHMVYLSGIGAAIVVDDQDRWFRCRTP